MTEPYGRCLPQYRAVGQNEQKSLEHDSSIHPDCIPERRAGLGVKSCVSEIRQSQEEARWKVPGRRAESLGHRWSRRGGRYARRRCECRPVCRDILQPGISQTARSENMISSWLSTRSQLWHLVRQRFVMRWEARYYLREKWLFGRMSGWRIKQQPAIAEGFGILSNAQNKAGNSTVSQDSQGIGYASPAVALTVLRPSALG